MINWCLNQQVPADSVGMKKQFERSRDMFLKTVSVDHDEDVRNQINGGIDAACLLAKMSGSKMLLATVSGKLHVTEVESGMTGDTVSVVVQEAASSK